MTGTETLTGISTGATAQNINEALQDLAKNKLEYGVGAGLGLEVTSHIQLSCQLFRNFGKLYKDGELGSIMHLSLNTSPANTIFGKGNIVF